MSFIIVLTFGLIIGSIAIIYGLFFDKKNIKPI